MTTPGILTLILALFGATGFWELLKFLIASGRKKKTKEQKALLALLQLQLYPAVEKVYFRGVVGYDEYSNLEMIYNSYRDFGGNSTIKSRFELIQNFKRVKDEELETYDNGIVRQDRM